MRMVMQRRQALTISDLVEAGPFRESKWWSEIREGNLPAKKAGNRTVVLRDDYENYLRGLPPATPGAPSNPSDRS
jgi:hypothetical protein